MPLEVRLYSKMCIYAFGWKVVGRCQVLAGTKTLTLTLDESLAGKLRYFVGFVREKC